MARKIEVELVGDSRSLERALGRAGRSGSKFGSVFGKVVKSGAIAAGAALAGLGVAAKIGFDEFTQGQKVAAQTNAVIKSTGKVANVSAKQVQNLAAVLMKKSGVDDEVIASGENVLLTFKKIRNEAGKGNDIFAQATKATLNLSVALGKDMTSSAIMVGKALNDPIKGLTAMGRAGIQFTEAQKEQIKALVESGQTMKAQKVILKELESQFGGSAAAAGQTFAGQINILRESFNNWAGDMVAKVMPTLQAFLGRLTRARGFKAKLKVVWTGVREAGRELFGILESSLRKASQKGGLVDSIKEGLRKAEWSEIGQRVGAGISSRVRLTADFISNALTSMNTFIDQHLDEFAELGAKMLLAIVSKLMDPKFWVENWKLVLGVAIAVFPIGRLASLGGKAAAALLGVIGRLLPAGLRGIGGRAVDAILGQLGRLPGRVQSLILVLVSGAIRIMGRFVDYITEQVGGALRKVPFWITAAFRLSAFMAFVNGIRAGWERVRAATLSAVNFLNRQWGRVSGPINSVISVIRTVYDWLVRLTRRPWTIVLKIPRPSLPDLPGIPGFASGGVVPGPRGAARLVMAHGGETVLPTHKRGGSRSSGGGGFPGGPVMILTTREIAAWLQEQNSSYARSNGGRNIF
jgi:hypothetical protein